MMSILLITGKAWEKAAACNWKDARASSCSMSESTRNEGCSWDPSSGQSC
jgi:hypothetical protein